jgi:hypothetical protein
MVEEVYFTKANLEGSFAIFTEFTFMLTVSVITYICACYRDTVCMHVTCI